MTEDLTFVALRSTFIGRERELTELEDALRTGRPEGRGLSLIRGDAGIGKTRLAEELSQRAATRGERTYWGRCVEGAGAPAYWPWAQVWRAIDAGVEEASAQERSAIARLIQVDTPATAEAARGGSDWVQAERERFQLFDAMASFLERFGRRAPFGIVLDDLHVADVPSLLLLELIGRQHPRSFWIVGTYREVEAQADPQRSEIIARILRSGRAVTLRGLALPDVERLIEQVVGAAPPSVVARRINDLTDGNPFFVDEVARLLWSTTDQPAEMPAQMPVPSGVREVVRQRLRGLSPECLDVVRTAAVIGRELAFPLLREATALDTARLLDLVDEAQRIRILEARPAQRLAFGHALIREALYDDCSASTRVALHRRVGSALERLYAHNLDEHLAELAYHFARAAAAGDAHRAIDYARRAGQRAAGALAYEDAAQSYELALDALPLLQDARANDTEIELLLALGDAYIRAGDTPRARATFERTASAARSRGDGASLARAALGCGGLGLGVPQGTVDRSLVALLEEALAQPADTYPPTLRVRLLSRLALELYFSDAVERRRQLMAEAQTLAASADAETQGLFKLARLPGLWDVTAPADRLNWCDDLIERAQVGGDDDLALRAHTYRLLEIMDTGIADAWEPELDTIVALGERLREPRFIGMIIGMRAMHNVWLGRFGEADSLGLRALEIAQSVRDLNTPTSIAAQSFFMLRLRGEADDIEASARAMHASAPTIPGTRCMLILALCALGRLDEARIEIEQLGDGDFDLLRRANRLASLMPWLAEATATLGDQARMQSLYRDLLPLSGRNITLQARVCFGPADFYLAMLAAGLQRPDEALQRFAAAHSLATRLRGRPLAAWIQTEHARLLLATGADDEGHALLRAARVTTTALGMHAITKRIDALIAPATGKLDAAAVASPVTRARGRAASLRRDGQLWTIAANGTVLRCKSSKGLQYLIQLLRYPGKSFHVAELAALDSSDDHGADITQPETLGMHVGSPQTGEPIVDARAVSAYRDRLEDLATELAEATRFNDIARSASLQAEIDAVTQALLSAVGFGGRLRTTGSFVERARLNVTRAIRSAIKRIGEGHPDLAQHLDTAVHTGVFCSYDPPPGETVRWEL